MSSVHATDEICCLIRMIAFASENRAVDRTLTSRLGPRVVAETLILATHAIPHEVTRQQPCPAPESVS